MSKGLTSLISDERQQLLRLVIERIAVANGVARIDMVIAPNQDNLRNRYPEPVEGCADATPTKNGLGGRLDPWIPAFAGNTGEAICPF